MRKRRADKRFDVGNGGDKLTMVGFLIPNLFIRYGMWLHRGLKVDQEVPRVAFREKIQRLLRRFPVVSKILFCASFRRRNSNHEGGICQNPRSQFSTGPKKLIDVSSNRESAESKNLGAFGDSFSEKCFALSLLLVPW